ncbi:hypothetical protein M0811_12838 [Anaeramoeba ignava]|uniref:Uncharacterized protein n=1 Tax=Anaeramoeba ignava TaxID=1746090 RepID=A0A9Q0L9L4_ANAIG|nr:hypothetical protein M0811_12838 [Anaeramoeba ignava]
MRNIKKDNNNNNNNNNSNNNNNNNNNDNKNSFILMSLDGNILCRFGSEFKDITTNIIQKKHIPNHHQHFTLINEIRKTLFIFGLLKFHWGIFEIGRNKNKEIRNDIEQELNNFYQLQENFKDNFSQNLSTFKKKIHFNLEQISKNNSKKD